MSAPRLLSILELGGYPNLVPLDQRLGFQVEVLSSQRKARGYLKKTIPDVVVAEFNYQTDFRDRSSNLETLMAVLQRHPEVKVLVFCPEQTRDKLAPLMERFRIHSAHTLPLDEVAFEQSLKDCLSE